MNTNFARLESGARVYAPSYLTMDNGGIIINPTAEQYISAGWLKIANNAPEPPSGYHVSEYHDELVNGQIIRLYEYAKDEQVPRVFSKLKLLVALSSRNLAAPFLQWVDESGYEHMWLAAQDLSESYEGFSGIVEQVRNSLGIDGETVETILSEAVV